MLYAPESQQMIDRFAGEIEDLRTIAKLHALPIGSPERLQALPLRLAKDVRLRSDLTELVRSLQQRDPDLGLTDVLSLLLLAIGGSPSLEGRRDMEEVVDLTGGFLASLGGWPGSEVEPVTDIDNPPDHDPRLDLAASAASAAFEADAAPKQQAPVEEPVSELSETASSAAGGSVTLAEITHALARLERGNLELRLHLDSIDQRICRMEPLLEAAPASSPVEDPPSHPEPTPDPRLPVRAQELGELVHRGSVVSEYELKRQREEEIKTQRRISLSSNFDDPVPDALKSVAAAGLPLQRGEASVRNSAQPARVVEPASQARASQPPRRDRFAAAREIPGNAADSDPLYTATDEELAREARASTLPPASAVTPTPKVAAENAAPGTFAAKIPAPDEVYRKPASSVPARQPERLEYLKLDPIETPAAPDTPLRLQSLAEPEQPVRKRTGLWIGSAAAVAVLGAAGFLYVNGLPSMITDWVSGSRTTASVAGPDEPKTNDATPAPNTTATMQAPTASPATGTDGRHAASAGRVLGSRESFSPSTSIEKTSGPTFVPGGVMDGYLISAPRPQYPALAHLAGVQGKISFEAMISKTGDVEALKVLGGPQLLRSAATDAVKQWQYRPFSVKGRPVEVRTIIRVDVASKAGTPADQ